MPDCHDELKRKASAAHRETSERRCDALHTLIDYIGDDELENRSNDELVTLSRRLFDQSPMAI